MIAVVLRFIGLVLSLAHSILSVSEYVRDLRTLRTYDPFKPMLAPSRWLLVVGCWLFGTTNCELPTANHNKRTARKILAVLLLCYLIQCLPLPFS